VSDSQDILIHISSVGFNPSINLVLSFMVIIHYSFSFRSASAIDTFTKTKNMKTIIVKFRNKSNDSAYKVSNSMISERDNNDIS
jgi:hypothetical protein